jgi:ABC-2 type transport system permease protein
MILRLGLDPGLPLSQVVLAIGVLAVSALVFMWAAGRIFRIGVLMYGKPPTPRELLRWLRVR